jgi:hypothetical protein
VRYQILRVSLLSVLLCQKLRGRHRFRSDRIMTILSLISKAGNPDILAPGTCNQSTPAPHSQYTASSRQEKGAMRKPLEGELNEHVTTKTRKFHMEKEYLLIRDPVLQS